VPVVVAADGEALALRFSGAGEVVSPGQVGVVYRGDRALVAGHLRAAGRPVQPEGVRGR